MEVYLDHNSTSALDPAAAEAMIEALRAGYANPASQHAPGRRARELLARVREDVARLLGARIGAGADRVIFTSGGTEANNLALHGLVGSPPGSLLISSIEHPSVTRTAVHLARRGFEIRKLPVTADGVVAVDRLCEQIDGTTRLVCLMLANNETGVLQPVAEAAEICRRAGVRLHCDAAQAAGKIPVDFTSLGVSSLSLGAHKFNGPRGIGALIVSSEISLTPLLFGGAQQFGLRPGTEDVALAVGLRAALSGWRDAGETRRDAMRRLRDRFERRLAEQVPGVVVLGQESPRLPQTTLLAFPGVDRQALFIAADLQGIAISIGSACASGSSEPSATALAMGLPSSIVDGAVRVSFGFQTPVGELDFAADRLAGIARDLRGKAPASGGRRPSRPS